MTEEREDQSGTRRFSHDGEEWVAWLSGEGSLGTGAYGLAHVEAVHFARAAEPARPLMEALLARGRFVNLFDAELCRLLAAAVTIRPPDSRNP
jgi:hypothetical protein